MSIEKMSIEEKRGNYIKMLLPVRLREYLTKKWGISKVSARHILKVANAGYKSTTIVQCIKNIKDVNYSESVLMNALQDDVSIDDEVKKDVGEIVKKLTEQAESMMFD